MLRWSLMFLIIAMATALTGVAGIERGAPPAEAAGAALLAIFVVFLTGLLAHARRNGPTEFVAQENES
jgi:uncharacterized membrane protein YtjA (UPF0391 family)